MKFFKVENAQDNSEKKQSQPKTEVAIMKSILSTQLEGELKMLQSKREQIRTDIEHFPARSNLLESLELTEFKIKWVREFVKQVNDIPNVLYRVSKLNSNVLVLTDTAGFSFELYLLRIAVGGNIYQLKDNSSGQTIDIVTTESDYFSSIEKSSFNGYLLSEKRLSEALAKLRNEGK